MTGAPAVEARAPALVARGEWPALLAAAGGYFCLLSGYYMLRSLREAMALEAGREHIPLLFYAALAVMLAILPLYWWLVARTPRRWLIAATYAPVVGFFATVALLLAAAPGSRLLAAGYFVGVTSLNLFMVSVFWSFMADLWRPESARRLFGFITAGGSAGALAGPAVNALFVARLGPTTLILIACALIALTAGCAVLARRLNPTPAGEARTAAAEGAVGGRALDDLARLARSPYLLGIAALIVAGQVLGALTYNEQALYVERAYASFADRAALFAKMDLAVNVLALLSQSLVVGWLTTRRGLRVSLAAMPALVALSFVALALQPVLVMLLATQVLRRAADYGLAKPTREMLFTVVRPESRFKSKSLLDTVLQRGGDSLGNLLYGGVGALGLTGLAALGLSAIAWSGAVACLGLVALAWWLGGRFTATARLGTPLPARQEPLG